MVWYAGKGCQVSSPDHLQGRRSLYARHTGAATCTSPTESPRSPLLLVRNGRSFVDLRTHVWLGEAAAIGGIISLSLGILDRCIAGIHVISIARDFGRHADLQRFRLAVEKDRLLYWYTSVKQDGPRSLGWQRIKDLLVQLEGLVTDASLLEHEYHLDLDHDAMAMIGRAVPENRDDVSILDRITRRFRPRIHVVTAKTLSEAANFWLKFRYAVSGKSKVGALVGDIKDLVDKLYHCLQVDQQKLVVRSMRWLLRNAVVSTSSPQEIQQLEELLTLSSISDDSSQLMGSATILARLKQKRLDLHLDVTGQEHGVIQPRGVRPRPPIKGGDVVKGDYAFPRSHTWQLGEYKSRPVLVEWKHINADYAEKLDRRVEALGWLLMESPASSIGILQVPGFFKDSATRRYGFIFQLPAPAHGGREQPAIGVLFSLWGRLNQGLLSVDARITLAVRIARSVRQLHTIGWLHKGIWSENILFVRDQRGEFTGPFLAGFGFARAANVTEFSEPMDTNTEQNIYCHSSILGPKPKPYRKAFDLYSLGLVLVEIGLGMTLSVILVEAAGRKEEDLPIVATMRDQLLSASGSDSIMSRLRTACPKSYFTAVQECLLSEDAATYDDVELTVDRQTSILRHLQDCLS